MSQFYALSWLRDATPEQLNAFCEHNPALITLVHDAWQKFQQERVDLFVPQRATTEPYAPNISVEDLTHSAISSAEMAEFVRTFERGRRRNDRPFADDVKINDQDWDVL